MGGVFPSLPGRGTLHLLQPWPRSLSQGGQGGGQGGGRAAAPALDAEQLDALRACLTREVALLINY